MNIYMKILLIVSLSFIVSACTLLNRNEPSWTSIICYNQSEYPICVTSLKGIGAYRKGYGPQNLGFGNMKPKGMKAYQTQTKVKITYPVIICWINEFSDMLTPKCENSVHKAEIKNFYGHPYDENKHYKEISIIFIFTGNDWQAFYLNEKIKRNDEEFIRIQKEWGKGAAR